MGEIRGFNRRALEKLDKVLPHLLIVGWMRRFGPIQLRDRGVVGVIRKCARRMRRHGHAALRMHIGNRRRGRLIRIHRALEPDRDEVIAGVRDLLADQHDRTIREGGHPSHQASGEDVVVIRHGEDIQSGTRGWKSLAAR